MSRFSQRVEELKSSRMQRRDAAADSVKRRSDATRLASKNAAKKTAEAAVLAGAEKLERINTISKNARGLWFGLLAALVFSGITLLQVEDIDFFGVNRFTQLPLVGVSVPVMAFFAAGGALTTAVYVYFHLYLVQLFEALGDVPPTSNGIPLSKAVYPWMVTDALIRWRSYLKGDDGSAAKRTLGWISTLVSFFFVWLFGIGVLWFFWWRSMPAHDERLTLLLGALLIFAIWVGLSSILSAWEHFGKLKKERRIRWGVFGLLVFTILPISWVSTEGGIDGWIEFSPLSRAAMPEEHLAKLSADWRDIDLARKWFRQDWCNREGLPPPCAELGAKKQAEFSDDFAADRKTYLDSISKPILKGRDLRNADLFRAFMPGIDLRAARLEGADLREARLEGADLREARLQGADLREARLEGADLSDARLKDANLGWARLEGANLNGAWLQGADLRAAKLQGANLFNTRLEDANLNRARLEGALLSRLQLEGANLRGARLEGALLAEASGEILSLEFTKFKSASLRTTALKSVDFTDAEISTGQLTRAFGDASVALPAGMLPICHWSKRDLDSNIADPSYLPESDDPFIGRWRGWVEANGGDWPTSAQFEHFKNVIAIPPPADCPLIKDM